MLARIKFLQNQFIHSMKRVAGSHDRFSSPCPQKIYLNSIQIIMKPSLLSAFAPLLLTAGITAFATPGWSLGASNQEVRVAQLQVAQNSRAEQTCVDAADDRGLQVVDVVSINPNSGGAEVIMEIRRSRNDSYQVGCDYSSATRRVELYEIEDSRDYDDDSDDSDDDDDRNNSWQNQYSGDGVRNRSDAEAIARQVVGDQLGIDQPNSSVVKIDDIQRENGNRSWTVEGRANGAPFVVEIRANDGYVEDFQLR